MVALKVRPAALLVAKAEPLRNGMKPFLKEHPDFQAVFQEGLKSGASVYISGVLGGPLDISIGQSAAA